MVANGGKHATKMNIVLRMPIENGFNVINKTIFLSYSNNLDNRIVHNTYYFRM